MGKKRNEYWLMDGRARLNIDDAVIYTIEYSLKEAEEMAPDYGDDTVIVKNGKEIIN